MALVEFPQGVHQVEVRDADLPWGVFGRWLRVGDRDVFEVARGLPSRDWTIAHELGHLLLGHNENPKFAEVADPVQHLRSCSSSSHESAEIEAERFAALLLNRLRILAQLSAGGPQELLG